MVEVTFYYHEAFVIPVLAIAAFVLVKSIIEIIPL